MTKASRNKSIIANFGALNVSVSEAAPGLAAVPAPRVNAGVIGATQRSIAEIREERDRLQAQLASGAGIDIDPKLIDPSPFPDRLPDDGTKEFEAFKNLFEEEGQKVPIQVRRHPNMDGRYQVVYGHRRWRAALEIRRPVKAIVVDLDEPMGWRFYALKGFLEAKLQMRIDLTTHEGVKPVIREEFESMIRFV
jgi:ParB family chromosome partitioning protein